MPMFSKIYHYATKNNILLQSRMLQFEWGSICMTIYISKAPKLLSVITCKLKF